MIIKDIKIIKRKGIISSSIIARLGTSIKVRGGKKSGGHEETVGRVVIIRHFEREIWTYD